MTVQQVGQGVAVNVPTTTETVAAVLGALAEQAAAGGGIMISGYVNITPGTTTSAVVIRVRQGTTTAGALVGTADTAAVTAALAASIPFAQVFAGAPPYGNQFCVTVQQTAATANGTVNDSLITLDAISVGG